MDTASKTRKGFEVVCPFCMDADATVTLELNDLRACHCTSCDAEFSPADAVAKAAETLARWQAVARWIEMAPAAVAE